MDTVVLYECRLFLTESRCWALECDRVSFVAGGFEAVSLLPRPVRGQGCQPVVLPRCRVQAEEEAGGAAAGKAGPRNNTEVRRGVWWR